MKNLTLLFCFLLAGKISSAQTYLTGLVTDVETEETLIGATVKALVGAEVVRGVVTDYEGFYKVLLEPGTYDLEVSYTGFETVKIKAVDVLPNRVNLHNIQLKIGGKTVVHYCYFHWPPLYQQANNSGGQTFSARQLKQMY